MCAVAAAASVFYNASAIFTDLAVAGSGSMIWSFKFAACALLFVG